MSHSFSIQGDGGASIRVDVFDYERRVTENEGDANWLSGQILVTVGGFSGDVRIALETYDVEQFARGLSECLDGKGKATFLPAEDGAQITVELSKSGRGSVSGSLQAVDESRVVLSFRFATDHTYIRRASLEVRRVLDQFPVRHL